MLQIQNLFVYQSEPEFCQVREEFAGVKPRARLCSAHQCILLNENIILLFITVISKLEKKKLKNERLNFENLGFAKMTKNFGFDVGNDLATEFHSSIHQTVKFNNFKLFWRASNLKCDCNLNEIPSLFLDNSFANVSNSTMHVRK